jgi:two-component system, cell cycle sensor histidine kinase and response regulator CckA
MSADLETLSSIATFADALPVAVWVGRAPGGEVVYVNREFESVLGITPPEGSVRGNYVGPYGVHLPSGERYPEDQMPFERVMRSKKTEVIDDIVIHRHDGTRCFLRVLARPLFDADGEVAYVVEAFTDITREIENERLRLETERRLQAVRRLESIGSLAGGVAHDFNNLLAIVKLTAMRLQREHDPAARIELADQLDEVADRAARLTRALLGVGQRGKRASRLLSVEEVAASVVELASRTFERRIEIVTDFAAKPDVITGDATQVEQMVMNLVMNARDALGAGGHIVVRTRREHVGPGHAVLTPGDHVVLEVEDDGPGIHPSIRERLFEPYVTTKVIEATGAGLGLATVYGSARAHGGTAELASTSSRGTIFRVLLPAAAGVALPARSSRTRPAGEGAVTAGSGTILVVDDEPLVLRMTASALESLGYHVLPAGSGQAGIEAFRAHGDQVDAVILDMGMSGMDGRDTFLALRAIDPDVRVLLATGFPLDRDAQAILDLGVRGFLSKPFDRAALSQSLAAVLRG